MRDCQTQPGSDLCGWQFITRCVRFLRVLATTLLTMSLFLELKRRNVFRVGAAYVVASWLVIQVVETIFPAFGFGDAAVRITTIALAIGLIPTLILAWAFELTPEGLKKESEVDRTQSITPQTGKKLDRMIMVVLALALGYFAFDKFVLDPQRDIEQRQQAAEAIEAARQEARIEATLEAFGDKSIAVLAFRDMSPNSDQEYLGDGIAEELLNLLARIPELRVISRTSAFYYKEKDVKLSQIAEELQVEHILEGSIRKAGNRVRITAQLIEARSDSHLWSNTYDRTLDDIFEIQDDIAATVVDELRITLLGDLPRAEQTDPEIYTKEMQARYLIRLSNAESLDKAKKLLEEILVVDPSFAPAWNRLATVYMSQADYDLRPFDEGYALAREAIEKALSLDPEYGKAHDGLGWIAMTYDDDLQTAATHYEKALELAPNDLAVVGNSASFLSILGRFDEAIALREYINSRDPLNMRGQFNLGLHYLQTGQNDDAITAFQDVLKMSPEYLGAHYYLGEALLLQGDIDLASKEFALEPDELWLVKGKALAAYSQGRIDAFSQHLEELDDLAADQWPSELAHVYAWSGDVDTAFEWLQKAVQGRGWVDVGSKLLVSLHDDPRWMQLLESMGHSPDQLAAIAFQVNLPN